MANGLLSPNPLDDPNYDYGTILPFRQRNMLDVDELGTDVTPEFAVPGLLRDVANSAVRMGQMARGERAPGLLIGDVMDFSPAGLLARVPGGATFGMNVWHGGPNRWEPEAGFPQGRPRLDKMGTGEGAQAYGRGFYSAESQDVGRGYRDDLTQARRLQSLDGMPLPSASAFDAKKVAQDFDIPEQDAAYLQEIIKDLDSSVISGDMDSIIAKLKSQLDLYPKSDADPETDEILKALRGTYEVQLAVAKKYKDRIKPNSGFLYKLDIPDANAAKFLDYDAPLKEQPKSVRDALKAYGNYPDNMKGSQIYEAIASSLAKPPFDNTVPSTKNPSAAQVASDALREMGIPGLRYLDRGSRGKGDGTRNFVVWDQDVLDRTKVLQRNDETFQAAPGVPAMGLLNSNNDNRPGGTNLLGLYTGGSI